MAHVQSNRAYRPRCEHALMSGHEPGTDGDDPLIDEAAAWLAKLRLSSGPREREAFETWYAADRAHAEAYDKVLRGWNASGSSGDPASDLVDRMSVVSGKSVSVSVDLGGRSILNKKQTKDERHVISITQ